MKDTFKPSCTAVLFLLLTLLGTVGYVANELYDALAPQLEVYDNVRKSDIHVLTR